MCWSEFNYKVARTRVYLSPCSETVYYYTNIFIMSVLSIYVAYGVKNSS